MARPVIALLSDFGSRDHYAGTMKGVILGICRDAALVDLSHEVPAHDVETGALELAASCTYFPPGTVFLVVVDPGVGTGRRGLAAEAGGFRFVAPDNGVLSLALAQAGSERVVELAEGPYARPAVSRTFEGRDRFAPAAAWLATGVPLEALGRPVADYRRLAIAAPAVDDAGVRGVIRRVDRFGNLISNIDRQTFDRLAGAGAVEIRAGGQPVAGLVATYAEIGSGEVAALFGSTGHLELAANAASAAERLALGLGGLVEIRRT